MICPNCGVFLSENSVYKRNIKKYGDADIEYDAFCPDCEVQIGVMSWGRLFVSPNLEKPPILKTPDDTAPAPPQQEAPLEEFAHPEPGPSYPEPPMLITPEGEVEFEPDPEPVPEYDMSAPPLPDSSSPLDYKEDQMSGHYCPHCGGDLPNDINLLPRRYVPKKR